MIELSLKFLACCAIGSLIVLAADWLYWAFTGNRWLEVGDE